MSLDAEVEKARQSIRTDDYPISIGEWISIYDSGDLDIHPEFQRFFRWSDDQKSNLIESIILGIPLPPIFVSQRADGVWDVVDGLQRLSTILELMGKLKDERGVFLPPLKLRKTKYLPSLEGKVWNQDDSGSEQLPDEIKRIIRRSKIGASILLRESDDRAKYDLFERLNTGGSQLSPQEVRNCILVMIDKSFYQWLNDLCRSEAFIETTSLSDKPLLESYDLELALRFLMFAEASEDELKAVGDVGVYLSDRMTDLASDKAFDRDGWARSFDACFSFLNQEMGQDAFKRYNPTKERHEGGFLVSQFEVVTAGAHHLLNNRLSTDRFAEKVAGLWSKEEFTKWAASGVTASRRLRRTIPFAREYFEK